MNLFDAYKNRDKDVRQSKYLAFKQKKITRLVIDLKKFVTSNKVMIPEKIQLINKKIILLYKFTITKIRISY